MEISLLIVFLGLFLIIIIFLIWRLHIKLGDILKALQVELSDEIKVIEESEEIPVSIVSVGSPDSRRRSPEDARAAMTSSRSVWEEDALDADEIEEL